MCTVRSNTALCKTASSRSPSFECRHNRVLLELFQTLCRESLNRELSSRVPTVVSLLWNDTNRKHLSVWKIKLIKSIQSCCIVEITILNLSLAGNQLRNKSSLGKPTYWISSDSSDIWYLMMVLHCMGGKTKKFLGGSVSQFIFPSNSTGTRLRSYRSISMSKSSTRVFGLRRQWGMRLTIRKRGT